MAEVMVNIASGLWIVLGVVTICGLRKWNKMSDEQLAAWAINEAPKIGFRYTSSETGLLKWLKQPAEEDD